MKEARGIKLAMDGFGEMGAGYDAYYGINSLSFRFTGVSVPYQARFIDVHSTVLPL